MMMKCPDCAATVGQFHAGLCPRNTAERYLTQRITEHELMAARLSTLELNAGGELFSGAAPISATPGSATFRAAWAAFERGQELAAAGNAVAAAVLYRAARKLAEKSADRYFRSAALRRDIRANSRGYR